MAGADIVIGPHGSGLGNCLFCHPGTVMVEIFTKPHTAFPCIASIASLDYRSVIANETHADRPRDDSNEYHLNVQVLEPLMNEFSHL